MPGNQAGPWPRPRTMTRTRLFPTLAAALALTAVACGDDATVVGTTPTTQPPGGGSGVVIQELVAGGFVPVEMAVTAIPAVTVLADGTVITPAPTTAIFPGTALAPLQKTNISPAEIAALLDTAENLGLLDDDLTFGQPPVADAPDTTVTITVDGRRITHSANALGLDDFGGTSDAGVTREQRANRQALSEFVDALHQLPPGEELWMPSAVAVYDLGAYTAQPDLAQEPVEWPLDTAPESSGDAGWACTVVEGEAVEDLLEALQGANTLTPWVVDGTERSLAFRPLVPGQPGCAS